MNAEAKEVFLRALDQNTPAKLINEQVGIDDGALLIDEQKIGFNDRPIYIIAAGKASEAMRCALQKKFNLEDDATIGISKRSEEKTDHTHPSMIYASHPLPDEHSEKAVDALLQFIKKIPDNTLVFFAVSGGTSALLCKPVEGISVQELNDVNEQLLRSGARIDEINSVRKHLSQIKGGQLLRYFPSNVVLIDLIISDVPGDDPAVIGSGPTTPDCSTFQDAYHTLLNYELFEQIPQSVQTHIEKGLTGEVTETLESEEDSINEHHSFIIGSAKKFAHSMYHIAIEMGYEATIADDYYNTDVDNVIRDIIRDIDQYPASHKPKAHIYYGESTIAVTGDGKGGRNQAMALRAALELDRFENVVWLSAGTDGIDGPTDAAGAIVDSHTITNAEQKGVDAKRYIKNNDSYHFHEKMNTHLKTGSTGNNMMDIVLVLQDNNG